MTRLPVLTYHAIDVVRSPLAVSPRLFEATMRRLASEGWRTLTEAEARQGSALGAWPDRSLLIHFDDGFASVKERAWPVLRALGFTATVFVVTGWVGRTNDWPGQPSSAPRWPLLDWNDLTALARDGATIGAHTVNHPWLPSLSAGEQADEVGASCEAVARAFGGDPMVFAYPYGAVDRQVKRITGKHATVAYGTRLALRTAASDALAVPRIDACYLATPSMAARLDRSDVHAYLAVRRAGRFARTALGR